MRTASWKLGTSLVVVSAIVTACGGDEQSPSGGGGSAGGGGADGSAGTGAGGGSGGAIPSWDAGAGIACAGATCTTGSQACCLDPDGGTPQCAAPTACAAGSWTIACDGPEDCPGQICCGVGAGRRCEPAASCSNPICRTVEDCKAFFPGGVVECIGEDPWSPSICVPIV